MKSSIVSYPDRGPYGKASYRGNTSGHIIVDLCKDLQPQLVVDPMEGSGTTRDVCTTLGIRYQGFDLHSGFNILRNNLLARMGGNQADLAFLHPAYHNCLVYSGNVWGSEPHNDDLSRCATKEEFIEKLEHAIANTYDAIKYQGHYAVLIGDIRKAGEYFSPQADIINMGIGKLRSVVIKEQHNTWSSRATYTAASSQSRQFTPIAHEYLLLFMKDAQLMSWGQFALDKDARLAKRAAGTWRTIVTRAMQELGGRAHVQDVIRKIEKTVRTDNPKTSTDAKIRQTLQYFFRRVGEVGDGVYELAA